jgi:hypothetical protein
MAEANKQPEPVAAEKKEFQVEVSAQLLVGLVQGQMQILRKQEALEAEIVSLRTENKKLTELVSRACGMIEETPDKAPQKRKEKHAKETDVPPIGARSAVAEKIRARFSTNASAIYRKVRERFPRNKYICPTLVLVKTIGWKPWPGVISLEFESVPSEVFKKVENKKFSDVKSLCRSLPLRWLSGTKASAEEETKHINDAESYWIISLFDSKLVPYESTKLLKTQSKEQKGTTRLSKKHEMFVAAIAEADEILERAKKAREQRHASLSTVEDLCFPFT